MNAKTKNEPADTDAVITEDVQGPLPSASLRGVIVDVLTTAVLEILLAEWTRVQERHEVTTC